MKKIKHYTRKAHHHLKKAGHHVKHHARKLFSKPFIAFVFLSLIFIVAFALIKGSIPRFIDLFFKNRFYEQIEKIIPSVIVVEDGEKLLSSSFTDLFSGYGWIDQEKTTMYRDNTASAFTFRPIFSSENKGRILSIPDEKREYCIGSKCAFIEGNFFVFDGSRPAVPRQLEFENRNLSLGLADSKWLLGGVVKKGNNYEGYIFFWDGEKFSPVCGDKPVFNSAYSGVIGFGESDGKILSVYGAYEGKAIYYENNSCKDVSYLFGIRPMDGGFIPNIARIGGEIPSWYVWGGSGTNIQILKVFEDSKSGIPSGVVSVGEFIVPYSDGLERVIFAPQLQFSRSEPISFINLIFSNGVVETKEIIDEGFEIIDGAEIISKNLNTYPTGEVRRAVIKEADIFLGDTDVDFYLSNDGVRWTKVKIGEEVKFSNKGGKLLLWKAKFNSQRDAKIPPYFSKIRLDFKVRL